MRAQFGKNCVAAENYTKRSRVPVYKFELVRKIYVLRYICHNSSACHAYVMWAELSHCYFLYLPAVLNIVTIGNGTSTKNVLNGTVRLGLSLVSSLLSTALLRK